MPLKAALIDLSGTLHVEDDPTPGAVEALERLRKTNLHIKFVTNTTKESRDTLYQRLVKIGFKMEKSEIFSSLSAAAAYIEDKRLNPCYLVADDALKDLPPANPEKFDAVVVGLAPDAFNHERLNVAFNVLLKKHPLIAIHQGKYYKRKDGLAVGPGFIVKGLEYTASTTATVIGKPTKYFFESAIPAGVAPEECVMIGDDAYDDVVGAMNVGMKGILVKTGKYLPSVVVDPPPTATLENFSAAVHWIEEELKKN
ncbi:unnamed protein product [Hermetia illucens]|uniref:Haloacid dehalogenase-like hydrolase domain-containing protein 2 n=2 Tax=Hermetia illucens TaxID=343691 RepID=A0A7R8YNM1_HERIL|nr:unnamed protein product [Hermetia illucens]